MMMYFNGVKILKHWIMILKLKILSRIFEYRVMLKS